MMIPTRFSAQAPLVAIMLVCGASAQAFDENDCRRLETVNISIAEDFSVPAEVDGARRRALDRAGAEAIRQVIGESVHSERESRSEINNSSAAQGFREQQRAYLKGLIRLKIIEEAKLGTTLNVDAEVTVCVPKPEDRRRPPRPADPHRTAWFNSSNGEPQLWYWRSPDNRLEFFDNSGFHPLTGDKLVAIDRAFAAEWKATVEREKQEALQRAEQERRRQEAEREVQQRFARAVELCDQFAANRHDREKPGSVIGASFDVLRANAAEAIQACQTAVQHFPQEKRYKYQLARAYQATSPKKAVPLLRSLTADSYVAAFDNLGWSYMDTRLGAIDFARAASLFRRGAELGDPSAMMSLARLIEKGHVNPRFPNEVTRLHQSAAALGHPDAMAALEEVAERRRQLEAQRVQNEQALRVFQGIVGGMIRR
jgi:hypothetical protein